MENHVGLSRGDVAEAKSAVLSARRRVLGLAVITPLACGVLVWALVYYLKFHDATISTFIAAVFVLLCGVPVFIRWWRYYAIELQQVDAVDARVAKGEIVNGSALPFHHHR